MNESASPAQRPLPHNVEAEQALLGALLINNEVIERVQHIVRDEDFFEDVHQQIFGISCKIFADGRVASPITLKSYLEGKVGELTIMQYLARLAAEAVPVLMAREYAKTIADLANRRRLIETFQIGLELAYTGKIDMRPTDIASGAIDALDAVVVQTSSVMPRISLGQAAREAVNHAEAVARGDIPPGLMTGIRELDRRINGFQPGEFVIIAARPAMGKSALLVSCGLNMCKRGDDAPEGNGVYCVSLEMTGRPLAERAISSLCFEPNDTLEYRDIRNAKQLSDKQFERMIMAQRQMDSLPFLIEQQGGLSLSQIATRARRVQGQMAAAGRKLAALWIDHLGLISPPKRDNSREREVSDISKGLKVLAKELGIPLFALAQLSRSLETRDDKRPRLSDLRESGGLEQDADVVIGLYREHYYLHGRQDLKPEEIDRMYKCQNELEAIILKQRQGPPGTATLYANMASNVICDPIFDTRANGFDQEPIAF